MSADVETHFVIIFLDLKDKRKLKARSIDFLPKRKVSFTSLLLIISIGIRERKFD